jgi:Ca-activated chloride channel family protein
MTDAFLHPWLLFLLVVPAAALCWTWFRRSRRLVLPFDHGRPGKGTAWRVLIGTIESLPPLMLGVAVILLAGPQRPGEPRDKRILTNIELCLDVSGSMTAQFGDGARYDTAMQAVNEFVTYRKGDAFGLTFFADDTLQWVPLTSDVSAIRCAPPFMRPENAPDWVGTWGTDIGKAIRACAKVLRERAEGERMMILVTDGEDVADLVRTHEEITRELLTEKITVFAVIIQENSSSNIQDEVINICRHTGGEAFLAGDPEAMRTIFKRIDQMKQTRVEKTIGETLDDFVPWAIAGLALAGVAACSLFGLRYTPW